MKVKTELGEVEMYEDFYFNKPSLILRFKSILIDTIVIIALMIIFSSILNSLDITSGIIRGIAFGVVVLYEPVFVTLGRTLGQRVMGLRIRKYFRLKTENEKVYINLLQSLFRYVIKLLLGWISLLTIHSDNYGRAIHDKFSSSVMTLEK